MKQNESGDSKNDSSSKTRKANQVFYAVALLLLWLVIYLAMHYKLLKSFWKNWSLDV